MVHEGPWMDRAVAAEEVAGHVALVSVADGAGGVGADGDPAMREVEEPLVELG